MEHQDLRLSEEAAAREEESSGHAQPLPPPLPRQALRGDWLCVWARRVAAGSVQL